MVCPQVCSPEMEKSGRGRRSWVGVEGSWGELQVGFWGGGGISQLPAAPTQAGPTGHLLRDSSSIRVFTLAGSAHWFCRGPALALLNPQRFFSLFLFN